MKTVKQCKAEGVKFVAGDVVRGQCREYNLNAKQAESVNTCSDYDPFHVVALAHRKLPGAHNPQLAAYAACDEALPEDPFTFGEVDFVVVTPVVVFTGSCVNPRSELKAIAEHSGYVIACGVSSKTTLVVAGESAGAKLTKAKDLNIQVMNEQQWLAHCGLAASDMRTRDRQEFSVRKLRDCGWSLLQIMTGTARVIRSFENGKQVTSFPAVGAKCEMIDDQGVWIEVEIIKSDDWCVGWSAIRSAPYYSDDPKEFRPLTQFEEGALYRFELSGQTFYGHYSQGWLTVVDGSSGFTAGLCENPVKYVPEVTK